MLNENEISGLSVLLESLSLKQLKNLLGTVTQNLLKLDTASKIDIINAIIEHSPNASSILNRKLITSSILYKYLHDNSVKVYPPVTKSALIDSTISHWNNTIRSDNSNPTNNDTNRHEYLKQQCTLLDAHQNQIESQELELKANQEISQTTNDTLNFPVNIMARTFAEWFYKLFNETNGLTSVHFWPDSSLRICIKANEDVQTLEVLNNADEVVSLLESTKDSHGLFFNPNISHEGVQGRIDAYGLTYIVACGTLHKENLCVGIFQQMFSLARDPQATNNWKMKNVELKLQSKAVNSIPSIKDSDYMNNILALPADSEEV